MAYITFGVLTVSDTCSEEPSKDQSGPKLQELIKAQFQTEIIAHKIVPDEIDKIKEILIEWSDQQFLNVILTTGGTGFAPRDVTPEATKAILDKEAFGISIAMIMKGLESTQYAMCSRPVCGIRNKSLIINLPGSVKAVTENFETIAGIIRHSVSVINGSVQNIVADHDILQNNSCSISKVKLDQVACRDRKSKYPMVEVDDALDIIQSVCPRSSDIETIDVNNALGRVLAEDIRSINHIPMFPASIKDGYAVRSCDGSGSRFVCDVKAAGDYPGDNELKAGQCVRISTGAPVPIGADAVVQVEDTNLLHANADLTKEIEIEICCDPRPGQDIRKIGSDVEARSIVLEKGLVLNAAEIGVLTAIETTQVKVFKRLSIGIISTGNELQESADSLKPGCIRDSNKITLISLFKQYGYTAADYGIARDNPTAVKNTFEKAFSKCDLIITTGGVSMGEFDVVKRVLVEDFNAKIHFGRVNMKPGKPTTFATCVYNGNIKTIFGLPGNPVSATVTCLLFVIPALRHSENRTDIMFPEILVQPNFQPKLDPERPDYQRVKLKYTEDRVIAESTGNQISSRLNSFVNADGLMIVPAESLPGIRDRRSSSYKKENTNYKNYTCYLLKMF